MQSRMSWDVKDAAIYKDLAELLGVTDEERKAISQAKPNAENAAVEMVELFYARLMAHEPTKEFLHDQDLSARKETIRKWFMEIFEGSYNGSYVQQRLKIGQVHVRIGLPVRYPLAMIDIVMEFGEKAVKSSPQPEVALRAFRKLLALDVAVFNQAYENAQLKHLSDMVGNESLARLLLTKE